MATALSSRPVVLLKASHPAPAFAVTALTALLAIAAGHDLRSGLLVTAAVATGQLSIGWSNDLIDAARDRKVGRPDKPIARGEISVGLVQRAVAVALFLCVVLSLACGLAAAAVHLVLGVGSGWAYNLYFKRTLWSALPYAVAFGTLPAVVTLALPDPEWPAPWTFLAGALLGVGAHLLNALPDLADDASTGVHALPHRLGERAGARAGATRAARGLLRGGLRPGDTRLTGALGGSGCLCGAGGGVHDVPWPYAVPRRDRHRPRRRGQPGPPGLTRLDAGLRGHRRRSTTTASAMPMARPTSAPTRSPHTASSPPPTIEPAPASSIATTPRRDPQQHLLDEQRGERLGAAAPVQRLYVDHGPG